MIFSPEVVPMTEGEFRIYQRLRALMEEAVGLEHTEAGSEDSVASLRKACGLFQRAVDVALPPRNADDATDVLLLRRVVPSKAQIGIIQQVVPPQIAGLTFRSEAVLVAEPGLIAPHAGKLTEPFDRSVYLIPKAEDVHPLLGSLAGSTPSGLAVPRFSYPHILHNTAKRLSYWPDFRAPLTRHFHSTLAHLPQPRGIAMTPVRCPGEARPIGVLLAIRSMPFSYTPWTPSFRLVVMELLHDLGWTVALFLRTVGALPNPLLRVA